MKNRVMILLVLVYFIGLSAIASEDPNMIGWWKFSDLSADYAMDSSGNGNHGILQGDVTKSTWAYDKTVMLYGGDDCVEIGHQPIFNITNKLTLAAWVRISSSENNMKIISKGSVFCFGRDYDSDFLVFACDSLGRPMTGSKGVFDYKWHHVAVVYDGSAMSIYVDGELDRTKAVSGNITANGDNVLIGNLAGVANSGWLGNIDDVRIYSRALSADEIKAFYYPFDLNSDKIIDMYDLEILANNWLDSNDFFNFEDYRDIANSFDERVPPDDPKWKSLVTVGRGIPQPLDSHPGNIFLEGDEVTVALPADVNFVVSWKIIDDAEQVVASGDMPDISAGALGIGWYWVSFRDGADQEIAHSTAAVLAKLKAPTPQDSPVCVDMATSWSYSDPNDLEAYINIATLAGINISRDRISWSMAETSEGVFAVEDSIYDKVADMKSAVGLKTLQVFHDKPLWCPEQYESFPADLRHLYDFCKEMAQSFRGRVHAWEPWNEANADNFGRMTIDEMSCLQKAAYLGLKAGDPNIIVGWNPYAGIPAEMHTYGVLKNEAWSYFDTYNAHTYEPPVNYNRQWAPLREAACGKPIWITESDRHMAAQITDPEYDFDYPHELLKANFMAQSYASSVYAGASRHFHFILRARYNSAQLLRKDFTPRGSYVALAAVGRFMAGAKSIGRLYEANESEPDHVYAFHGKPDGVESDVLVAWAEAYKDGDNWGKTVTDWPITEQLEAKAVYDYLGRYLGTEIPAQLTGQAVFVILKPGELDKVVWEKQEHFGEKPQKPVNVMMQLKMPKSTTVEGGPMWSSVPDHVIAPNVPTDIDIWAYNFSDTTITGQVVADEIPAGFILSPGTWNVTIEPMGRVQLPATAMILANPNNIQQHENWFRLKGDFGEDGEPVLAFRLLDHWEKY